MGRTPKRSLSGKKRELEEVLQERDDDTPCPLPLDDIAGQLERLKSSTIMMVDDEPTTIEVVKTFLEGEGYRNFVTTTDPRQALHLIAAEQPDILLLDLMMPHISGLEILAAMRSEKVLQHTPVIILTSVTDAEPKLQALNLGAADFLSKPVDSSELALRLRNTLASKAYRDRLTYYDGSTGLPNRRLFMERLDRILGRAASMECAVFHIELGRLQQITDTLGRTVGDRLLKAIAERLQLSVRGTDFFVTPSAPRESDLVSRVGDSEFLLLVTGLGSVEGTARVARRVHSNLEDVFQVDGHDLFVTSRIGIALFPNDGENIETLLRSARIAISRTKQGGVNPYHFYSEPLNAELLERLSLENQLRGALDRDELFLEYQPKVDMQTGQIIGAEALIRWQNPERGLIPPAHFIPIAEEIHLIGSFGEWVLRVACRQNKAWQDAGFEPIRISVNVSSEQFRPGNLPETIRSVLQESGLEAKYLVLELTESLIMENPDETSEMLYAIKEMGVKISVDDFGTGYSSLASLKRFPLDELKIDRSFVSGVPHDVDGAAIVTAIIGMAQSLGLQVVAEGVETEAQLAFLKDRGCDEYQGRLCSRPVPPTDWPELIGRERDKG